MPSVHGFAEFELDEPRFELRLRGRRVPAQPKVLRMLFYLVANRHRSVSERELLEALWPGEVVGTASVKRAVRGARIALGERGDGESSIRTVRGHGYQFILPVREVRGEQADPKRQPESATGSSGVFPRASEALLPAPQASGADDVFVGREAVLFVIEAALADVLSGQGRSLLIAGEPGIGKTRTLRELVARAGARGALTWFGRCAEVDGAPAFWPVIQILRETTHDIPASELRALMGPGAADIAEAIPELRQWLPDLPDPDAIGSVSARFRFFDSMALFLKRAAERRPIVLLVDDLQRADQPTLRLLEFLARELERSRVLLAAATRGAAEHCGGSGERSCRLSNGVAIRSIELQGLTREDIARCVELRMRGAAPDHVIDRLHDQTAGNPLFLEQILHAMAADRAGAGGPWERRMRVALGQGLRAAIDRHLEGLTEGCRITLRIAAVLGRDFSLGVLAQIAESSAESVWERLSEAVSAGILQSSQDSPGSHRFSHALIRDAMYEQLTRAERARLHLRAGAVLEARGAAACDALLPQLAEHYALAAPADEGRALHYALRAARAAKLRLAYEEAAHHLDRALGLLELGPSDPRKRMQLLLDKGEALGLAGLSAPARACLLHAAGLARELGASQELASAAVLLARAPESGSVDAERVSLLQEALAVLPDDHGQRPCLQALLAKSLIYARDPDRCARSALAALASADQLAEPAMRAEVLQACHEALAAPDYLAERLAIGEQLALIGHELGDRGILLQAAAARVWNSVELGNMAGADSAIGALETLVEQVREPIFRWHARMFRAMRAIVQGQLEQAELLAREAHALGTPIDEASAHHAYCVQMFAVLRFQGRLPEAEKIARDASLRHPTLCGWRATLATIEAGTTPQRARVVLDQLFERDLAALRGDPFVLSALAPAAELCAAVGDEKLARTLYEAILPYENHHGNVSFGVSTHGPMARHLGVLALRMGDAKLAERHLQHAIRAAEVMPSPPFESVCCIALAQLLLTERRREARERAAALLGRALATAKASGLWALVRACRAVARGAGLSLPASARESRSA
jgi:DNA-binding winged helix-turn-helix (wHTH) protein